MQLSIIIVNYEVKYFLEQCLYSVLKACESVDAEIFVIDNNSADGSREYFSNRFEQVHFIWNTENKGFAAANNQVLNTVKGDFVLYLNPDTILAEDSLSSCIQYFHHHSSCGALGVKMIDGKGEYLKESKRSFPSPSASFYKMVGLAKLFPQSGTFAKYYAPAQPKDKNGKVDVLAGAFLMLRNQVLKETKGFDESFFMYGEDIDLSYRIQQAGFENHYFSGTTIVHFKGESAQLHKKNYTMHFYAAMQKFIRKHYRHSGWLYASMSASIFLAKAFATVKRKLYRTGANENKKNMVVAVVASQELFNKIIQLIKFSSSPLVVKGRIAVAQNDNVSCIGNISSLHVTIEQQNIDAVFFCENDISYKEMITLMQQNTGIIYGFHARQSMSIVGSGDKNHSGFAIANPH